MSSDFENRIVSTLEVIDEKLDRLDRTITGGDKPGEGMIVRLDRLEQSEARRDRWMGWVAAAAGTGLVTGIGTLVWRLIQLASKP